MNRRNYLTQAVGLILLPYVHESRAAALRNLLHNRFDDQPISQGRVHLQLPALAENGNSVRLKVTADLNPEPQLRLAFIQLFAPANPEPVVAKFVFGELAANGEVQTRIRVAADQAVAAVAGYSDGSLWIASADIVVTEAACLDALY